MKKVIIICLLVSVSALLLAVPANPEPTTIFYKDGRSLTVYLKGDENRHWHETEDGLHVKKNTSGEFEYISSYKNDKVLLSGIKAHDAAFRDLKEIRHINSMPGINAMPVNNSYIKTSMEKEHTALHKQAAPYVQSDVPFEQTDFPTLGSQKFLCILVDFPDKPFTHTNEDFDSLFNAKDYTYNYAIGSVNEYYRTTSYQQFDPTFDIVGPFTVDSGYAFYGKDEGDDTDVNVQRFVYDAVKAADPTVDFSEYDLDSDGYVDNIYFIYAGYGQASGAPSNTIWPHRWAYWASNLEVDGKYVWDYSTSNELLGTSGSTRTSIGVICHEFGHVCGLPDFYDTDYGGSGGNCGGLGGWDEMAGGSWNDGGRRPPIFNAWSRMYLKWANPIELSGNVEVTLDSAYTQNDVYYFWSPTDDEFFMVENRQQVGFDLDIPGHGMLIFHIDLNHSGWSGNSLNVNPDRQGFDLEEADGFGNPSSAYTNAADAFPGTTGNTDFTDSSNPNALDWANNPSRSPIRNIRENAGIITFSFGDIPVDTPTDFTAEAMGYDSVRVSWNLNAENDSVMIVWAQEPLSGFPENLVEYDVGDSTAGGNVLYKGIDTVYYHTGLLPGTTQYYSVYAFNDSAYIYSEEIGGSAKTKSPPFYSTDFSEGLPKGWIVYDRYGNGTFSTENPENRVLSSETSGNGFITMDSEHAGNVQIDAELITQSYNFALSRSVVVKFQHRLEVSGITLARLLYTINNGLSWFEAGRWTATTADPDMVELDLSAQIMGFRDVKFKFNYKGTNQKYWCIDDFEITAAQDTGLSAGFHAGNVRGSKPLTVEFMNTSVSGPDTIDSYIWEFGDDGQFYTEKEPTHTYTASGKYTVSLAANKNGKISNFIRENYIEVINDAPMVIVESDTLDVAKNTPNTYNLKQIFMDPNDDPMTFSWSGNSANLSITLQDDSLAVLTPGADYLGTETVVFVAKDIENDSTTHAFDVWVSETGLDNATPSEFHVSQNYPNPFNPVTTISFQLPADNMISLNIYDLSGHKVRTLINGFQDAGYYSVNFNAADLPSGVYLYRLTAGNEVVTKKMVLMK